MSFRRTSDRTQVRTRLDRDRETTGEEGWTSTTTNNVVSVLPVDDEGSPLRRQSDQVPTLRKKERRMFIFMEKTNKITWNGRVYTVFNQERFVGLVPREGDVMYYRPKCSEKVTKTWHDVSGNPLQDFKSEEVSVLPFRVVVLFTFLSVITSVPEPTNFTDGYQQRTKTFQHLLE